jgi:hypothetical protein
MNKLYELQKREKKLYKLNKKLLGGSRPLALQDTEIREERLRKEKYSEDKRKYDKETIKRRILNAQQIYQLQEKEKEREKKQYGPHSAATLGAFRNKLENYEPPLVDMVKSYITNYEVSAEYRDIMRDPIKSKLYKLRPIPMDATIVSICTPIIEQFLYEMIGDFDGNIYNTDIPYDALVFSNGTFGCACHYMQNYVVDFTFFTPGSHAEYYASRRGGQWINTQDEIFIDKYGPGPYYGLNGKRKYYDAITLDSILTVLVERDRAMEFGRDKYERKESARRTRQMQETQRAERSRDLGRPTHSAQALLSSPYTLSSKKI